MAFSDFRYPELLPTFGLTDEAALDLFAAFPRVPPSPTLTAFLAANAPLAVTLNTEKARGEWLIAPVLGEVWSRFRGRVSLYSGAEFTADPAAGLNGYCDYIFGRGPQRQVVAVPVAVIIEAKRENIHDGLGQCIAATVGAQRLNRRQQTGIDTVYGCVTTGTSWKFLQLAGTVVTIDLKEYPLAEVDQILGILTHMVGPVAEPAAA